MPKQSVWRPFRYNNVYVIKAIDGDTIDADIDIGFHMTFNSRFRLLVANTPERRRETMEAWHAAKDFTQAWCDEHAGFIEVETMEKDSFGRWLALFRCQLTGEYLNQRLIDEGHSPENYRGQSMDQYTRPPTMLAENMHTHEFKEAVRLHTDGYLKRRAEIRARQAERAARKS